MSKHRELLEEAQGHLDKAAEHVEEERPRSARRRIGLARGCIERALEGLYVDPTKETGAQVSDGNSPRLVTAAGIRLGYGSVR